MARPKAPNQRKAFAAHFSRVERYAAFLNGIYAESIKEFSKLALSVGTDPLKPFQFSDYPQIKKKADALLRDVAKKVQGVIVNGVTAEWEESNFKNDALALSVVGIRKLDKIPERFKPYFNNNAAALEAFIGRKTNGLGLSDRVWKLSEQYKTDLELALSVGLSDGRSAAELSRDVRQYLNEPNKLFRRVMQDGRLRLSKAAKAYHPGQGVYRSSYKNAMRLTRTEVNMAYRTADNARWGQMDFVVGFEVKRFGRGYDCPVCASLAGKYPKGFIFSGWHPHCRCYTIQILKTEDEFWAWDGRGEIPTDSVNTVTNTPQSFNSWVDNNKDRIDRAKQLPYFLRDNKAYWGGNREIKTLQKPTIYELARQRQAARTPGQIRAIKSEWNERQNIRIIEKELGIRQGKPMSFEQANELRANMNYGKGNEYYINCQSCVVANELRRRGFDVTARGNTGKKGTIPYQLSHRTELAWIDPKTGKTPAKTKVGGHDKINAYFKPEYKTLKSLTVELKEATRETGRYHIDFGWKNSKSGHIITIDRLSNGTARIYDPQSGKIVLWKELSKNISLRYGVNILRVDQLLINTDIIANVTTKL